MILLRIGKRKLANKKLYCAKKPIKIWDVNYYNIVISKLIETKNSAKYLIGYLDDVLRSLVLKRVNMLKLLKIRMIN